MSVRVAAMIHNPDDHCMGAEGLRPAALIQMQSAEQAVRRKPSGSWILARVAAKGWHIAVTVLLFTCGCGRDSEFMLEFVDVSGTVTMDGQPLADATVAFIPTESKQPQPSFGYTDEEGKYELQSPKGNSGVCTGTYRIVVSKMVMPDGSPIPRGSTTAEAIGKELVPFPYNDPRGTPHEAKVTKEGETFDVSIDSTTVSKKP